MSKEKNVPEGKEFITMSGKKIANLYELYDTLIEMPDDEFKHHVDDSKNDFMNWIEHIIDDKKLAEKLSPLKSKEKILDEIEEHVLKASRQQKKPKREEVQIVDLKSANDTILRREELTNKERSKEFLMGMFMGLILGFMIYRLFFL
ncbi:hypothetical protein H6503_04540 [Candidatus Woesearchaeota archaeon]|nr:hypothetical protein [Candidatus Woesearchaeota archaeon]